MKHNIEQEFLQEATKEDPYDTSMRQMYSLSSLFFALVAVVITFISFFLHLVNKKLRKRKSSILMLHLTGVEFLSAALICILVMDGSSPNLIRVNLPAVRWVVIRFVTRLLHLLSVLLMWVAAFDRFLMLRKRSSVKVNKRYYQMLVVVPWCLTGILGLLIINDADNNTEKTFVFETGYVTVYSAVVVTVFLLFCVVVRLSENRELKKKKVPEIFRKVRKHLKEDSPWKDLLFVLLLVLVIAMPDAIDLPREKDSLVQAFELQFRPALMLLLLPRLLLPPLHFCCDVHLRWAWREKLALVLKRYPPPNPPHPRHKGAELTSLLL